MHGARLRCVVLVGFITISVTPANAGGSLAGHMASHIVLMNLLAPVAALAIIAWMPSFVKTADKAALTGATVAQITALWTAHTPYLLAYAVSAAILHAVVQATLFLIALWFWWAVFVQPPHQFWRALFALLITGKLFCLLGALLVFAPRTLYAFQEGAHHAAGLSSPATDDQQLAGLLMLLACPLSYVTAGIVIAYRALKALEAQEGILPTASGGR